MLIGLHKMAAERGDGFIPEMLDVLQRSAQNLDASAGLVRFPERADEPKPVTYRPASNENNVIAFPVKRRRR